MARRPALALVAGDDVGLDRARSAATRSSSGRAIRSSPARKWYFAISPEPLRYSRGGSVAEHVGVAQHRGRLPERADQVLALGQVHAGLAADGGVDLPEQRGRHVHDRDAAVVDGGGEPGGVGDQPAADGDDARRPG